MNEVVHRIKLDVTKQGTQARIKVKKGDTGTRKLKIMLVNGSVPYEPEAASVAIYADIGNATIFNACELYGNIVTVVLPNGMISAAGTVECELRLQDGANVLFSPKFEIAVEDTICDDSALEATNEYTALTEAIADAQALHDGYTFTPSVDADGNLSWSNDGGLANPETVNIRGPEGPAGDGHEHSNKAALDQINIENGKVSFGSNSKLGLGDKLLIDASGNYCDITGGTAGDVLRIGDGNLLYNGKNIPFSSDIPTVDNTVTATGTNPVSGKAVAEHVAANLPTVDNTVTPDGASPVSGAAVAAYVAENGGTGGEFRLLRRVTISEEVASVIITADEEENPFSCVELALQAYLVPNTAADGKIVEVCGYVDGNTAKDYWFGYMGTAPKSGESISRAEINIRTGKSQKTYATNLIPFNSTQMTNYSGQSELNALQNHSSVAWAYAPITGDSFITGIIIKGGSGSMLGVGCEFVIFGR